MKNLLKRVFRVPALLIWWTSIHVVGKSYDFWLYLSYLAFRVRRALGRERFVVHRSDRLDAGPKICVFCLHLPGEIPPSLLLQLEAIRSLGYAVMLLANGRLLPAARETLLSRCFEVIERENVGRDFGGYKAGILRVIERPDLEELMIANESVFCPLHDLATMHRQMKAKNYDFWGITEDSERFYHIQSFYVVFERGALRSPAFLDFWRSYRERSSRRHAIFRGEIRLTRQLLAAGLRAGVYCGSRRLAESIQSLDLEELYELMLLLAPAISVEYDGVIREHLDLIQSSTQDRLENFEFLRNTLRKRISRYLSYRLERISIHHATLALIRFAGLPVLKKDILWRGLYDFGFVTANIHTTTGYPLDEIEIELRSRGRGRTARLLRMMLAEGGYI